MGPLSPAETLTTLRRILLALVLIGLVGTSTELLLIGHDEDTWQLVPLVALGCALVTGLAMGFGGAAPAPLAVRAFRGAMVLLIACGAAGAVLHYRANMEFKLEMDPSMHGLALFWSVIQAKAPPALAPGNMALLGLLGLTSTFRLEPPRPSGTLS